jgi:UDP-N-acetylmuramoyl-tripeptide--D-alanyl-D-alanine ligase
LADLLRADGAVVATPKSFNNQAGLSRAINEGLADGTKIFIAEMGTYGPGEIAALCDWCQPDVAIITAIGPVHLERMGDLETIERAKFEITAHATTVILNVDDERLRGWISRLDGRRVVTAGATSTDAMVRVVVGEHWTILRDGVEIARIEPPAGLQPTNVACAVAAALEVGVAPDQIAARCHFSPVPNRLQSVVAPSGVTIVDDTFNANPASGASALAFFMSLPVTGRRVVVTPGLIELGDRQALENSAFARAIEAAGCELVIVNRTNADALSAGHSVARRVAHRDDAVAWVRSELVAGDGVLYVNDLPDQYP